jgi:hypothetical protein
MERGGDLMTDIERLRKSAERFRGQSKLSFQEVAAKLEIALAIREVGAEICKSLESVATSIDCADLGVEKRRRN